MDPVIPVFDLQNPWVALIQLVLLYVLPRLTGLVNDRLAKPAWKIATLGVLSVVGAVLTRLLDVAVANSWADLNVTDIVNLVVNAALLFLFSNVIYKTVIVPNGTNERDARNTAIQLIGPDPRRQYDEARARTAEAVDTIAARAASAEVVARRVATQVVEEKIAEIKPKPRAKASAPKTSTAKSAAKTATKPAEKATAAKK